MNLPQYPSPPGNRNQVVATITGPASYVQITTGSPPTGGLVVTAQQLGLASLEWVEGGCSDDGQYIVKPIFDSNPAKDVSQVRFIILTVATGAQVAGSADLHLRTFRVFAFGL